MADPEITPVRLEVFGFKEMLVCVDGRGEQSAWLRFAIRLPGYPRKELIYVKYKRDIGPDPEQSVGGDAPQVKLFKEAISDEAIGTLNVRRQETSDSLCPPPDIGRFSYWQAWNYKDYSEQESFDIQVHLTDADFDRLERWVLGGRYPSMVTIYTPDIYNPAWSPDTRMLEWQASGTFANDSMSAHAAISRIAFHYEDKPLAVTIVDYEKQFEREARVARETETRQAVMNISEKTATIESDLKAISSGIALLAKFAIRVVVILIAITAIALHFAEHFGQ
jgi:hypothetical protein